MYSDARYVLTTNAGSSSIKFALFRVGAANERALRGEIDRIGRGGSTLQVTREDERSSDRCDVDAADHASAARLLVDWLSVQPEYQRVVAVGHRVVHGMTHTDPELVSPALLEELRDIAPCDPEHLPGALALIDAFLDRAPALPQVACFDTAFHRDMPRVATLLPLPRRFDAMGVRRYGFHGLSYAYLVEKLTLAAGPATAQGRVILAHLGSGASLAAVREGRSIDTSMSFTPSAGLPMATRSGDLDPGLAPYLERTQQITSNEFFDIATHQSGLLGVSGTSADMRDLLAREAVDVRAAEAVAMFCYAVKKWIGSYAAALGGVETLVFAGGIGENAPVVRSRICDGLGFLGIELDERQNRENAEVISAVDARVTVRVMRTDEEVMIARSVVRLLTLEGQPRESA
ncbi:MAG: acetate/propionate family kinase [Gemmatimonadaceae bacterium]|nr:acetate/propionate family kinase [Gemmatimonadaceae bacterium]